MGSQGVIKTRIYKGREMQFIKRIFWNSDQRRLRALWRLVLQPIILFPVLIILETVVGVFAAGQLMEQADIGPDQLTGAQATAFIQENPIILMTAYLALLPAMTFSIWLAGRILDRRSFADFGFHIDRDWWIDLGFGLGLGAVLMLVVFLIEWAAGWVSVTGTFVTRTPETSFLPGVLVPLLTFLAVGFYEELFSRGYQLTNLAEGLRGLGPRAAILIATLLSSAVFGLLHLINPNAGVFSTVNIVVAGFMLAMGYILTGELAIPIGLHITWNFFQGIVFGFPVSGTTFGSATFIAIEQGGPDFWTGGAFGPEGGVVGLGAIILGIGLTVLWVRRRYGQAGWHTPLADPPTT